MSMKKKTGMSLADVIHICNACCLARESGAKQRIYLPMGNSNIEVEAVPSEREGYIDWAILVDGARSDRCSWSGMLREDPPVGAVTKAMELIYKDVPIVRSVI